MRNFPSSLKFQIFTLSVATVMVVLTGCVSTVVRWEHVPVKQPFILGAQYAASTGNAGCETVEVFVANPTSSSITFTKAVLDGEELPSIEEAVARQTARRFQFDIGGRTVAAPPSLAFADERATWWQFYPSATIPAGGSGLFQINFKNAAGYSRSYPLALSTADGMVLEVVIPHYTPPSRRITAVTWSPDGRVANIQYTRGSAPENVFINGGVCANFRLLTAAGQGNPGVVVVPFEKPVAQGASVLVELDFGADGVRRAFVRASPGILIDGNGWENEKQLSKTIRNEYGFDDVSTIYPLSYDVACNDTRANRHGNSAPDVAIARAKAYRKEPGRLTGVDFCTALYASIWNIYAPLTDAVVVKPYQLHWGSDPTRFIESEDEHITRAVSAASARPTVWVPERFKRNRYVEGEELKVLAWTALLRGVKGIRYHYWKNNTEKPFVECPELGIALQTLNTDIRKVRAVLSPLVSHAVRINREQRLTLYEGWCGDAGVLLLARNMRYTTDESPNDNGANPRFHVDASENIPLSFTPPLWLHPAAPVDLLTDEKFLFVKTDSGALSITLPQLNSYRLVWIANTDSTRVQK